MSTDSTENATNKPQEVNRLPLPVGLLKQLFTQLGLGVEQGDLQNACSKVQQELAASPLQQKLAAIIKSLQLSGVQPLLLRWRRFDQRRLPALIWHKQEWYFVEPDGPQTFKLQSESGQTSQSSAEALDLAIVLWLKVPNKPAQESHSASKSPSARMVLKELFKNSGWLRSVVIATVIVNLLAVCTSIFAMQVYDRVVPTLAYATLWTLVVGMGIVTMLDWYLKIVRAKILDSLSCTVDRSITQQVFEHVMQLRLDTRPRTLGTLAAQIQGLDSVRQFFSSGVVFGLVDMPFAILFIAFIALIGGHIGWVYLALLPVAAILGWVTQHRLRNLMRQQMMRSNERQGLLVDAIRGSECIRSNGANWRFAEQWQEITATVSRYNIQQKTISTRTSTTAASLSSVAYVAAIVVGVGQIEAGNLTMGALIACSILGGRVIAPIARSVQYLAQWQSVSQALSMVDQVLELEPERRAEQTLLTPEQTPEKIQLDNIRFAYPESPVQQLNIPKLTFQAGERVFLVGPIGCGKSTLLKVIAGLYKPSEGRIRIGDADLWELDPALLHEHMGYLPQNVHLFKGTLRSNLALSGAVSDSELLKTCQQLGIDRIASDNPKSMDLEISEGGEGLSGGQKQLVGLGRLFLGHPKIWLLDEPTSSLDNESDNRVMKAIQERIRPEDILIISTHRLAMAAQHASRMIVMHQGEITADGKPEHILPKLTGKRGPAAPAAKARNAGNNKGPFHVV